MTEVVQPQNGTSIAPASCARTRREAALEHFRALLRALPGDTLEIEIAAIDYATAAALDAIDAVFQQLRSQRK